MMMRSEESNFFRVVLSFLAGLLLTVMPLPHFLLWCRPQWMLAIVLFWVITKPAEYGVLLAWMIGLLTDLVTGTPFGQQAIIFVVIAYFVMKLHPIVSHSPRWQQAVIIGAFSGCAMVLQSIVVSFMGHTAPVMRNELSVITTVLIWPVLYRVLEGDRRSLFMV